MSTQNPIKPTVNTAAPALNILGIDIHVLLRSADTGGEFSTYTCTMPQHDGPPPHTHVDFDEAFTVLEGALDVLVDGEWRTLNVGDSVFIPRGAVHTFRNSSNETTKFFAVATPGGHEEFFFDACKLRPDDSMETIISVFSKHRIDIVAPGS